MRRIRDELSGFYAELEDLAAKAGAKEAEGVVEAWLEGRIGDEEALGSLGRWPRPGSL